MDVNKANVKNFDEFYANFKWEVPEHYNFAFDVVDIRAEETEKVALISVNGEGESAEKHTFRDLKVFSDKFANILLQHGATRGEKVFIMLPRVPEWYIAVLGTMKISGVYMPTPTLSTEKDVKYRINSAEAGFVVTCTEFADRVDAVRGECPSLKHCILVDGEREGWISYADAMSEASPELVAGRSQKTRSDEDMLIFFTSGTEGPPKMVLHSYAYPLGHYASAYVIQDLKPEDTIWTLADTGWAKAAYGKLFGQWIIGATVLQWNVSGKFDPQVVLNILAKFGVTVMCAPPTAFRMIIQEDLKGHDFSKLRHSLSAGEPLNPEIIRAWKDATGTDIYDYYGQTETVPLAGNVPSVSIRPGSMGKAVPGHIIEIVDEDGNILGPGEEGHIALSLEPRPPGLMKEYWKNDEANKKAFRGKWYYTGDRAYKDEKGYIWFVGRADDVIKSSGYRIGPFEVESALQEHIAVVESAVIGIPDELRGQLVKAFIVLAAGYEPSEELTKELQNHVKKLTAPYKYPRIIEYRTELPKTISGKIKRAELRKEG